MPEFVSRRSRLNPYFQINTSGCYPSWVTPAELAGNCIRIREFIGSKLALALITVLRDLNYLSTNF